MTIALAKDVEDFLREQVQAGVAADPSALANDVLRCVRDQQRKPFEITPQLEAWVLEAADQPATPLTKADFDGIRQRARNRTPASGACPDGPVGGVQSVSAARHRKNPAGGGNGKIHRDIQFGGGDWSVRGRQRSSRSEEHTSELQSRQ